jgi:ceramide glucosyltransferase
MRLVFAGLCALGALCSLGYYVLCLISIRAFLREGRNAAGTFTPPVSILKPLKGMDPELYDSFRSHCLQDYPEYEILFGVSDLEDPAVPYVRQLQAEFPQRDIRLIVCPDASATNRKVGNLAQMLLHARYDYVLVNDSDIRVSPKYLQRIMAPFRSDGVGMVTAPYRAVPQKSLWSRIEALGISTDFMAGVLAARKLEGGIRFGLGSTLAMRRTALDAIGGFAPLFEYLGDDYELGARIARSGFRVVLSHEVVDTFLPDYRFRAFFDHQLRWARAIRDSRPKDYVGMAATFGVPWALLAVAFAEGAWWSIVLLLVVLGFRFTMAQQASQRVLGDPYARRDLGLVPVRDVLAMLVWLVSFFGETIVWRGERFRLQHGKLIRLL